MPCWKCFWGMNVNLFYIGFTKCRNCDFDFNLFVICNNFRYAFSIWTMKKKDDFPRKLNTRSFKQTIMFDVWDLELQLRMLNKPEQNLNLEEQYCHAASNLRPKSAEIWISSLLLKQTRLTQSNIKTIVNGSVFDTYQWTQ